MIRAIEIAPTVGWNNANSSAVGPINLAKALSIVKILDKTDVPREGPLFVCDDVAVTDDEICQSKRKNLKTDREELRRFYLGRSRFVS